MESSYFVDDFVTVSPGDPFRLLPFGTLIKNGKRREITPAYAATFRLPHFRPPLKLGSHKDETPAGGHIIGLEVRDDGLYAIPEMNEEGAAAVQRGAYRYHSPEIIWQEGAVENPQTGELNTSPLIWGAALLHTPHLGEQAAFYTVELNKESIMSDQTVTLPMGFFDKLMARLTGEPQPAATPPVIPDEFAVKLQAAEQAREDLAAKVATLEAEQTQRARVEKFASELKSTPLADAGDIHTLLSGLSDANAAAIVQQFKALSAQIDESKLTGKIGNSHATNDNPVQAFNSAIVAKMQEAKVDYNAAVQIVAAENPALYEAYKGGK